MRGSSLFVKLAVLISIIVFVVGCGLVKNEPAPAPQRPTTPVGQITIASLVEPNTLNPYLSDLQAVMELRGLIYSGLVTLSDKGEWLPDLATEVPTAENNGVTGDGLIVRYQLRSGATWHDGVAVTADDVRFTWQWIMNRKNPVVSRDGYDRIASVEAMGTQTVIIRFKEYYPGYLQLFSAVLPRHVLEHEGVDGVKSGFNKSPVGSGPFRLKEWRLAEGLTFEAYPQYFGGKPALTTIVYKILADPSIMLTQMKSGQVDIVSVIPGQQIEQVKAVGGYQTLINPSLVLEHLDFNLDHEMFRDVKVRQAIGLAIDRQAIVQSVYKGAAVAAATDQPPISWAVHPSLRPEGRDLVQSRQLLAQAGWNVEKDGICTKNGQKFIVSITIPNGNPLREAEAKMIGQQLKEIGIQADIRVVDASYFFDGVLKNRRFEMALFAWVTDVDPDNRMFWNSKWIPGPGNYDGQNYAGWRNPQVDDLTERGLRIMDVSSRKQYYYRIQELIRQEYPVIPLYYRANVGVVKNTLINYAPNPSCYGNYWNAWQWAVKTP